MARIQAYSVDPTVLDEITGAPTMTSKRTGRSMTHCDDVLDNPATHPAVRVFLERARAPGHGMLTDRPYPRLFADHRGARVRVTMASRMGDVGITKDLDAEFGYEDRVALDDLDNFSDQT